MCARVCVFRLRVCTYLTISTGTASPTNMHACTVKQPWRKRRKAFLPLERHVWTRARTQTLVPTKLASRPPTAVHVRPCGTQVARKKMGNGQPGVSGSHQEHAIDQKKYRLVARLDKFEIAKLRCFVVVDDGCNTHLLLFDGTGSATLEQARCAQSDWRDKTSYINIKQHV